ncbi:F0F1 ATP synthase subunit B [Modestobacter versicolor]|uniref:F0F1 ATP synthase subunit B n=1 Tax=Modestobacter versicolor TaxID=429133 RepID=UPI0034DFA8DF
MSILAAESANPLIPPVGEIIIGLIAFAIVLFVMFKFVAPQFEKAFVARRDAIEGGIARAEAMQAEAKASLEQYRAQLAEARTEAAQIRDSARAEGQQIIEELRAQAQEESARIVARGEEQLASSRQQVVNELRGQIGTLAVDLAGRVVGESLADDARRSGTVDRFLDSLDGMSATTGATPGDGRGGSSAYVPQDAR